VLRGEISSIQDRIDRLGRADEQLDTLEWPTVAEIDVIEREWLEIRILGSLLEPWRTGVLLELHNTPLEKLRDAAGVDDPIPF
jgi:hypothetical protein